MRSPQAKQRARLADGGFGVEASARLAAFESHVYSKRVSFDLFLIIFIAS